MQNKKDLVVLAYGNSFSADIIKKAKELMISKGRSCYSSRKLDGVPRETIFYYQLMKYGGCLIGKQEQKDK